MTTQEGHSNQLAQINHIIDNYRTDKITEIEERICMARDIGHTWCLLKCYYRDPDSYDNIAELIRSTTCPIDKSGLEYNLFYTAIVPVMNHFQTRGYTVELVEFVGQCDLILRWSN